MSLEAIEKVTEVELESKERRGAAEAEARQIIADAERTGLALLQKVRADAASEGKALLRKAEERAAERAAEISANASREADGLRQMADKHMEAAAEFIVGRVVKH